MNAERLHFELISYIQYLISYLFLCVCTSSNLPTFENHLGYSEQLHTYKLAYIVDLLDGIK